MFSQDDAASIKEAWTSCYRMSSSRPCGVDPEQAGQTGGGTRPRQCLLSAPSRLESGDVGGINEWEFGAWEYLGEPIADVGSPKQMKEFLYTILDLPVCIVNSPTENEAYQQALLTALVYAHKKVWLTPGRDMTTEEEL